MARKDAAGEGAPRARKPTLGVCLPEEDFERFREIAEREDITPSQLGRRLVREFLRAQPPTQVAA